MGKWHKEDWRFAEEWQELAERKTSFFRRGFSVVISQNNLTVYIHTYAVYIN